MNTIKKILLLTTAITVLMLCFVFSSSAYTEKGQCGDKVTYSYDSIKGELVLSGAGPTWNYEAGTRRFESYNIKKIIVKSGVTTIGDYLFSNCSELTSLTLSSTVRTIGKSSFYWCKKLGAISFSSGLAYIGEDAFSYCDGLKSLTIPGTVSDIGKGAFASCATLESVKFNNGVKTIGETVFYSCEKLKTVTIPKSVTKIGENAFEWCKSVKNISVDSSNKYYSSDTYGVLFNKNKTTLLKYTCGSERTAYNIPKTVKIIGSNAFEYACNLIKITIPDSVTTLNDSAFYSCKKLKNFSIPNSVVNVGRDVFAYCESIEEVTIPSSIKDVAWYMFTDCKKLKKVNFEGPIEYIGQCGFSYCPSLPYFEVPHGTKIIQFYAFVECTNLKYITLPNTIELVDSWIFDGCSSLKDVYYYGSREQWEKVVVRDYFNDEFFNARLHFLPYVTTTSNTNSVNLSWTGVEDADGYSVYIKNSNGWKLLKSTTARSYKVTNLNPGTKYSFAVRSYEKTDSGVKYEDKYTKVDVTTKKLVTKNLVMSSQTQKTVSLKWDKTNGAVGYRVYLKTSSGWKALKTTPSNSYTVTGLSMGTKYTFAVRSYTKVKDKVVWENSYAKVTTATKCATPTISLATTAKGRATVAWTNVAGETGYQVYYATSKTGTYKKIANYKANTTKIYKTGLSSGKTYYFKVRAYTNTDSGYVYSAYSPVKSIKVK